MTTPSMRASTSPVSGDAMWSPVISRTGTCRKCLKSFPRKNEGREDQTKGKNMVSSSRDQKSRIELHPVPPYNFDLSARFFSDGDPQIQVYDGEKYIQVIRIGKLPVLASFSSTGMIEDPVVSVELETMRRLHKKEIKHAEQICISLFNLNLDLVEFYEDISADPTLLSITRQLRGLKIPATESAFEALVNAIIEQQLSLEASYSIEKRLIKTFGEELSVGSGHYYAFPTPDRLALVSLSELHACGISLRKCEYIRDIALTIVEHRLDLESLKKEEDSSKIYRTLRSLRGIGEWSAEYILLRGMHRLDSIPAGDVGLMRAVSRYYRNGTRISAGDVRKISRSWGKWRGLAIFYVMIAAWTNIEPDKRTGTQDG